MRKRFFANSSCGIWLILTVGYTLSIFFKEYYGLNPKPLLYAILFAGGYAVSHFLHQGKRDRTRNVLTYCILFFFPFLINLILANIPLPNVNLGSSPFSSIAQQQPRTTAYVDIFIIVIGCLIYFVIGRIHAASGTKK